MISTRNAVMLRRNLVSIGYNTSARDQGDEVSLGKDADQAATIDNRKASDFTVCQKSRRFDEGGVQAGGDYIAGHHLFDRQTVQDFPLGVPPIAKCLCECVAKEIALAHDADDELTVITSRTFNSFILISPNASHR